MTTPEHDPRDDEQTVGALGSEVSAPTGDDDSMAGPVYPPPETEPDAHPDRH